MKELRMNECAKYTYFFWGFLACSKLSDEKKNKTFCYKILIKMAVMLYVCFCSGCVLDYVCKVNQFLNRNG